MRQITSEEEYMSVIDNIVENRNTRDRSGAEHVSNVVLLALRKEDESQSHPLTVAEPYLNSRITPSSVLCHSPTSWENVDGVTDIREKAVRMLSEDLRNHSEWKR